MTLALACGRDTAVTDSSVPLLRGEVSLEIGAAAGPDEYIFGRVSGAVADSTGRIVVADAQANEIRVFSPTGEFLYRAAREGGGPGEVQHPCCLAFGPAGWLWVRDGGNGRYLALDVGASGSQAKATVRIAHGDVNFWAPITFDSAGNLVDVGHRSDPEGVARIVRFHRDRTSGALLFEEVVPAPSPDSVDATTVDGRTPRGSMARFYLYKPFGSVERVGFGPGGNWATAVTGAYAVRWVYPGGERIVHRDVAPLPLSPDERASAERRLADEAKRAGIPVARHPFSVPDTKAPLRELLFDARGRLWVVLTTAAADTMRLADVYDTSGLRVAQASWHRSIDLSAGGIRREHTFGVRRDSLGVERVVRLTWREP